MRVEFTVQCRDGIYQFSVRRIFYSHVRSVVNWPEGKLANLISVQLDEIIIEDAIACPSFKPIQHFRVLMQSAHELSNGWTINGRPNGEFYFSLSTTYVWFYYKSKHCILTQVMLEKNINFLDRSLTGVIIWQSSYHRNHESLTYVLNFYPPKSGFRILISS